MLINIQSTGGEICCITLYENLMILVRMLETPPGTLVLALYSLLSVPDDHWYWIYPRLFLRGFAEWIFIIGVYGVMR